MELIVIGFGIWETVRPWDCRVPNRTISELQAEVLESVHEFLQVRPDVKIIWQTAGWYAESQYSAINNRTRAMENDMLEKLDAYMASNNQSQAAQFSYVNWGGAIAPRSFDAHRIPGDVRPHYGSEPRMVLIQMINNRFYEMLQSDKSR
jgi:hypothetical protein